MHAFCRHWIHNPLRMVVLVYKTTNMYTFRDAQCSIECTIIVNTFFHIQTWEDLSLSKYSQEKIINLWKHNSGLWMMSYNASISALLHFICCGHWISWMFLEDCIWLSTKYVLSIKYDWTLPYSKIISWHLGKNEK